MAAVPLGPEACAARCLALPAAFCLLSAITVWLAPDYGWGGGSADDPWSGDADDPWSGDDRTDGVSQDVLGSAARVWTRLALYPLIPFQVLCAGPWLFSAIDYHIFLTPRGDSNGLYVSGLTSSGFEVREQKGGASSLDFDYRVVARRKDIPGPRLEKVKLPEPIKELVKPDVPKPPEPPKMPAGPERPGR